MIEKRSKFANLCCYDIVAIDISSSPPKTISLRKGGSCDRSFS